jgi:hypothetical protein
MMNHRTKWSGFLLCGSDKPAVFQVQPADMPGAMPQHPKKRTNNRKYQHVKLYKCRTWFAILKFCGCLAQALPAISVQSNVVCAVCGSFWKLIPKHMLARIAECLEPLQGHLLASLCHRHGDQ